VFRRDAGNPFRDYNYVLLPYCTGDLHTGSRLATDRGALLRFMGYANVGTFLRRIVPTFASARKVILAGSSAGGYGVLFNYERVRNAFAARAQAQFYLIDDSGPTFRPPYSSTQDDRALGDVWGTNANRPPGCARCSEGLFNLWGYYAESPSFRGSLLSSLRDNTICKHVLGANGQPDCAAMPAALSDFAQNVAAPAGPGAVRTYYVDSAQHVWLGSRPTVSGVSLMSFLAAQVADDPSWGSVSP
jgi:hypothetical protein